MPKTIVIFCGGTGGHVLPSVNFGNYLIENGYNCILITDKRGNKYTDQFVGKIKIIKASHLTGSIFFKIAALVKLFIGFIQSLIFLSVLKPNIAISFGSYASLPSSIAVRFINIFFNVKFFVHEQNSIMGKTNKFLLKFAVKVFVNYEKNYNLKTEYSKKINVVGLPTSSQIKYSSNFDSSIYNKKNLKYL